MESRPEGVRGRVGYRMDDMRIVATLRRMPSRLAFWALAGVALLLSHDAIFAFQVGPGQSLTRVLREAGHDYWGVASAALALVGLGVAIGAAVRLRRLKRRAMAVGAVRRRARWSHLPATWLGLFAVVAIGFVIQENIEHALTHMHAPGLGALLGPQYPLALPVIALITGMAAVLATAVRSIERELLVAIAAALRLPLERAPRTHPRPPLRLDGVRISPLALAIAGRAPPRAFAQLS